MSDVKRTHKFFSAYLFYTNIYITLIYIYIYIYIYKYGLLLEALIKQYITKIEQKNKKRDVFDKGLASQLGKPRIYYYILN